MEKRFVNLIMLLTVSFLTVLSVFFIPSHSYTIKNVTYLSSNPKIEVAPYSDEYLNWLSLTDEQKKQIPMPRSNEQSFVSLYSNSLFGKTRSIVEDIIIPTKYDLRNVSGNNYTTPIKNQGLLGLCWSYSTISALESNLKLKGQGTYNFNPIHTNYILAYKFEDNTNNPYGKMGLDEGGNFSYTSSYLTTGYGPVTNFSGNGRAPLSITNTFVEDSNIQVDNTYILPSFENYNATSLERQEYNNIIKKQIMDNGGVYFHVAAPSGSYYNSIYDSVYTDNYSDYYNAGHAMMIIGWDDSYSSAKFNPGRVTGQRPKNNGAWIVQNSWGTSLGDNGYYYYSYEDYMIGDYMAGIISASTAAYDNIYQYNPTGLVNHISGSYGAVVFNKNDLNAESLTEVSFNINQPNTNYEIYVNAIDGDLTGSNVKLVQSSTSTVQYPGYHTVNLDTPILLKGKEYAVIVHFINSGYYRITARANEHIELSDELVGIMPSQNFVSFDGIEWHDAYENVKVSVDIKAYTEDYISLDGVQIDTALKNDIIITDSEEVNYIISANTITNDISNGTYLSYLVKDSEENDITNRFIIEKNLVIGNQVNASLTAPNDIEIGFYTIETIYNDKIDTDYFAVINMASDEVETMYSNINSAYIALNETRDLNSYIIKTDDQENLIWESDNASSVSVNDGVITGLQEGSAIITVSTEDRIISDTINITVNDVILIDNASQLNSIRNNLSGSYKLVADIDISAWNWNPIGNNSDPFIGTFNGDGHTIKGTKMNKSSDYNGLFGKISGASIKKITLLNSNIKGANYTGTLAGYIELSELDEIFNIGIAVNGEKYTGGIAGYIVDSNIVKTFNTTNTTALDLYTGGLAGYADNVNTVNSYNNGNINGIGMVGGIFGGTIKSKIEKVFNTGDIYGRDYMIGGIIGYGENFILENAYNNGDILDSTASYIGGIVGFGNNSEYSNSLISKTYNVGNIDGGYAYIGGIFGASSNGLMVSNSYDIMDLILAYGETGYASLTNTVQKTTQELTNQTTFVNFDFINDWGISTDQKPYLKTLPLLNNIIINTDPLSLDIGDEVTIDIQFDPDTVLNKVAIWETSDKNVISVDNGKIRAIGVGNAVLTITADGGSIIKNIDVLVDSPISSNEYSIHGSNISQISNETSLEDFIENIDIIDPETTIKLYQKDGITEYDSGIIGTNMILETTDNDKTIRFNIVVKGDVTGDGYVRVNDIIRINNHIIGYIPIDNPVEALAADVTGDGNLRVNDIVKVNNYIINPLTNPLIERTED